MDQKNPNKNMSIAQDLLKYAELKAQEKTIAAQLEELKPGIKAHLEAEGVDKLPTNLGVFAVESRSTWKYTEAVSKLQDEEKATGKATQVTTTSLRFTPKKEDASE